MSPLGLLRHLGRAPQVLSAIRTTPDWLPMFQVYALGPTDNGSLEIRLRNGSTVVLKGRDEVAAFWQIFVARCYDVHPSDRVIIDAGANVGLFALRAMLAAPQSRVVSIEPHPVSFERMRKMLTRNGLMNRVQLIQSALGGDMEPRWIEDNEDGATTGHRVGASGTQVECLTLSAVLEKTGEREIDLLKMDIESSEYETLLATPIPALRTIRRVNVELHVPSAEMDARRRELLAYMQEANFALSSYNRDKHGYGIAFFTRLASGSRPI